MCFLNVSTKPIFDLLQTLAVCNSAVKQCQGKYLGVWLLVALRLILVRTILHAQLFSKTLIQWDRVATQKLGERITSNRI